MNRLPLALLALVLVALASLTLAKPVSFAVDAGTFVAKDDLALAGQFDVRGTVDAGVVRAQATQLAESTLPDCAPWVAGQTRLGASGQRWMCSPTQNTRLGLPSTTWLVDGPHFSIIKVSSLPDPSGLATTAGQHFGFTPVGDTCALCFGLVAEVTVPGQCTAPCVAGTSSVVETLQENHVDGGQWVTAELAVPCTAPVGTAVCTPGEPPESGCAIDGGVTDYYRPNYLRGSAHWSIRADGGQCNPAHPEYKITTTCTRFTIPGSADCPP